MTFLVLGIALWIAAHLFKRTMPNARARLGGKGKGVIALVLLASIILMVIGFRATEGDPVYDPPSWGVHLNNLLMVISVILFGLAKSKSRFRGLTRHPMLAGVRAWAVAHLLVNGDLASVVLFASLFLWATVEVIIINRAEPEWEKPEPGNLMGDLRLLLISAVIFSVISVAHYWLGYPVFPG